jgi:DNA polymerase V
MSWIGLLDCNNFFVSCERLFRPDLHGRPVVVLSSNDGCVVARSQEVKDMGVPMGVPYFQIKDTLEKADTAVFSSHFALYRDVSRRVFSVMREVVPKMQQYSVDEAFFACTEDPAAVAAAVKCAIEREVGVPVSVGVSFTKTMAKQASALAKRGTGVRVLDGDEWSALVAGIPLASVWGVGGRLELRYKQHGIVTVADLLMTDPARIQRLFGVGGVRLQRELAGTPVFPLNDTKEPQKSIMSSRSFARPATNLAVVQDAIAYHVRHAAADLRAMGQEARVMRVSIRPSRHSDYVLRGGSAEVILPVPTADSLRLLALAGELVETLYEPGVPYQKAGVVFSGLVSAGAGQADLFGLADNRSAAVLAAVDALNGRAGREVVQLGSRLRTEAWRPRTASRSPAYTTRWDEVASVRA